MNKNIIYGLRDPRNDVYQYIGKSTVGESRPLQHLTKSHSSNVNNWVKELADNWLYPKVDIIEEVDDINDLPTREKYWVDYYYAINPELLNIQLLPQVVQTRSDEDNENFNNMVTAVFNIGALLKKERVYRKLTQQDLANKMGVSRTTVNMLENNGNVTISVIQKAVLILKEIDIKTKLLSERVRH